MQLSEIAALIRTSCHQVRCWKDGECVKSFLGSFNCFIVNTNCVNEGSVRNITSAKRELVSTAAPKRTLKLKQTPSCASHYISLGSLT